MAKGVGRPRTKSGKAAEAHRKASRTEYRELPVKKKQARVKNRSAEAQRQADAKRLSKDRPARNAYHKTDAKATAGVPKGTKCSKCGATKNVQRHVVGGKFKSYLCGKCNTNAIGGKP